MKYHQTGVSKSSALTTRIKGSTSIPSGCGGCGSALNLKYTVYPLSGGPTFFARYELMVSTPSELIRCIVDIRSMGGQPGREWYQRRASMAISAHFMHAMSSLYLSIISIRPLVS